MKRSVFAFAFMAMTFWVVGAQAAVTLRSTTELRSSAIRLSDVFDGLPPGKDCDIAIAPAPGRSVTYEERVLIGLAQQYSLEWKPQSLADRTVLSRAAAHVTSDMIEAAVLRKAIGDRSEKDADYEVQFDGRNAGLTLPADADLRFDLNNFTYDEERRRFRGEITASAGTYPVTQVVSGHIIRKREVPVLARALPTGTLVGETDLKWIRVDDERLGDDIVTKADQIIGMETRRSLNEEERIRSRDVMQPRLVTRGGMVTLKVETPLMLITTQGRALQDGAKGETVRVVNTQSNRTIEGTVESTGVVRIGDPVKMAAGRSEGAVQ